MWEGTAQLPWTLIVGGSDGKEIVCNVGGLGSIPGSGRSPGEGTADPLQYSCLENPMDRGAWGGYSLWGCKESDIAEWLTLTYFACLCVHAKLVQSCLTLCNLTDCRPPGSSVPGLLQAWIQSGLHALLQGIFLTQGLKLRLLHLLHWQVLYH